MYIIFICWYLHEYHNMTILPLSHTYMKKILSKTLSQLTLLLPRALKLDGIDWFSLGEPGFKSSSPTRNNLSKKYYPTMIMLLHYDDT